MKEIMRLIALVLFLVQEIFSIKLKQVPQGKDLKNHFGSEPKNNLYGPHHFLDKNSFLFSENNFLSKFNPNEKLVVVSGEINDINKKAENIISPYLPVK